MILEIQKSIITGAITPPTSKSHTIRAILLGSLAEGETTIINPLLSGDGMAPIKACELLGADFMWRKNKQELKIVGTEGNLTTPSDVIDIQNSGTSLYFLSSICAQLDDYTVIKGDSSINKRPIKDLVTALNNLGGECFTTRASGTPPIILKGKLKGGETKISGITSQFTSSLLLSSPLSLNDSIIRPINLQEKPYVDMTLDYLKLTGIKLEKVDDYSEFRIEGNQTYQSFTKTIPSDFSSAAFLIGAGVIAGNNLVIKNLDFDDNQADKVLIDILKKMNADIKFENKSNLRINKSELQSTDIDLSQAPDLLPIISVVATQAEGTTIIKNVEHARIKETDRIKLMCLELKKMGANISESRDGLVIKKSNLNGGIVSGYGDHRIAMSLSVAGLITKNQTTVEGIEAVEVTYPTFIEDFKGINALVNLKQ